MVVMRTEYRNLSTGTIRSGSTARGESLTDLESYLLPLARLRGAALYGWGVADGLRVLATPGQAGVTVTPGLAVDAAGRDVALTSGGIAVTDPAVDPGQVQNVPTVPVGAAGVGLSTSTLPDGEKYLTVTWREVFDDNQLATTPSRLHAPWLRLTEVAGFGHAGDEVVLARVTVAGGTVTALSADGRRAVAVIGGRLVLHAPRALDSGGPQVENGPGVELRAVPAGGGTPPALAVTGAVGIGTTTPGARLDVDEAAGGVGLRVSSPGGGWGSGLQLTDRDPGGNSYGMYAGADGSWHFADVGRGADRLVIDRNGFLGVGVPAGQSRRTLQVDGLEVHSGGAGAGFSFANRQTPAFVESPPAGERWVWYASGGAARLWSGRDHLAIGADGWVDIGVGRRSGLRVRGDATVGAGGDGVLSVRHVAGKSWQNDAADGLFLNWATGQDVHVGGQQRAALRVHGDATVGAGGDGVLSVRHVVGKSWQNDTADGLLLNWATGQDVHVGGGRPAALRVHGSASVDGRELRVGGTGLPPWSGGGMIAHDVFGVAAVYAGNSDNPRAAMYSNGQKTFIIDHPLDPAGMTLTHACIEGPEAAVYYRGEGRLTAGTARVVLPAYFEGLARPEGRTVMLTAVAEPGEPVSALAAGPVADGTFLVRAADRHNPVQRFCWEVKAVRADVAHLRVEAAKRVSAASSAPAG